MSDAASSSTSSSISNSKKKAISLKRKGLKFIIPVVLMVLFLIFWVLRQREEQEIVANILVPVRVSRPELGTIKKVFKINGNVESETTVTVLPKISGTLVAINVDVGDYVQKGLLIASIDSEPYLMTLRQAEAAYLSAEATYWRMNQLFESNATSRQNYDQAESAYKSAKSQYELAELNYRYTHLVSPMEGVVLQKHTSAGSLVASGIPIVTLGDLKHLVIKAALPEKHYSFFLNRKEGIKVEVEVPALENRILSASIRTVAPYIRPETKSFETVCDLSGITGDLRPGMFVRITFALDERANIHYLPYSALIAEKDLWYVVPDGEPGGREADREPQNPGEPREPVYTAKKMSIKPTYYNNDFFQIDEEYSEYDFIIEGQHFLKEDQRVRVLE